MYLKQPFVPTWWLAVHNKCGWEMVCEVLMHWLTELQLKSESWINQNIFPSKYTSRSLNRYFLAEVSCLYAFHLLWNIRYLDTLKQGSINCLSMQCNMHRIVVGLVLLSVLAVAQVFPLWRYWVSLGEWVGINSAFATNLPVSLPC